MTTLQFMPPQPAEVIDALRVDIRANGIQVPIVVDQHGRILDGHHRRMIADELGIDCPVETVVVTDDEDAERRSITLNTLRRHLTQEQRRELIADQIKRHPELSDREIARRTGSTHPTVAKVRRGGKVYHPDALSVDAARELHKRLVAQTNELRERVHLLMWLLLVNGADPFDVLAALEAGRDRIRRDGPALVGEDAAWMLEDLHAGCVRVILDPDMRARVLEDAAGIDGAGMDEVTLEDLLDVLANPLPREA